ncbi:hypothetical protein JRO89_XS03G0031500 [Xanthoceras sorbifolium]|uniref:DNA-directed RNA polymerase subunit n=1 Tax=Xanthoceras sorbifolium TaxID=99658 RepID=A0ABQ8I8V2_9ROSI|nr:hypothetical protein JRO89_XS03G0031500 [Xanthoceras sorbifolium]
MATQRVLCSTTEGGLKSGGSNTGGALQIEEGEEDIALLMRAVGEWRQGFILDFLLRSSVHGGKQRGLRHFVFKPLRVKISMFIATATLNGKTHEIDMFYRDCMPSLVVGPCKEVSLKFLTAREKMFFHIVLERNMQLHPRHFGRNLREHLVSKLMKDVEGTCSGRHGFVVAITGVDSIGKGLIRDGTGFVTFPVKYQCVVFRPFKGEIVEAVVSMVNKMGFFAEAGPVQIFVSNHLIPDDMEFQSGDMPNYTTSDGSVKIQKDSEVRLKIIGTRVDAIEIVRT